MERVADISRGTSAGRRIICTKWLIFEECYPELRTPKFNLVDKGVFPNKVYSLAVYVNITTHS